MDVENRRIVLSIAERLKDVDEAVTEEFISNHPRLEDVVAADEAAAEAGNGDEKVADEAAEVMAEEAAKTAPAVEAAPAEAADEPVAEEAVEAEAAPEETPAEVAEDTEAAETEEEEDKQ